MSGLWLASYVVLWALVLALAVVLVSTLRNLGVVYTMVTSLPAFSDRQGGHSSLSHRQVLPEAVLATATGGRRATSEFKGTKTAFAVVSASCGPCSSFLESLHEPEVTDWRDLHVDWRDLVVVSLSGPRETEELLARARMTTPMVVLLDGDGEIKRRWGVTTTPFMVVVDEELRVVNQVVGGGDARMTEPRRLETAGILEEVTSEA